MAAIEGLEKRKQKPERRIETTQQAEVDIQSFKRFRELARSNLAEVRFEDKRLALEAPGIKVWLDGGKITVEGWAPMVEDAVESTTPPGKFGQSCLQALLFSRVCRLP